MAAAVGAVVWGVIAGATGYEIGYIAWGIGLLVGGTAKWLGGAGSTSGVGCALLALGSIFVGKMLAIRYSAPAEIRKMAEAELTRDFYEEMISDAEALADIEAEEDYPSFMVFHEYSEAESAEDVTVEEIDFFTEYTAPQLREFHADTPSYEVWRKGQADEAVRILMDTMPISEIVVENLGAMDILFALLGIGTAYKLGAAQQD